MLSTFPCLPEFLVLVFICLLLPLSLKFKQTFSICLSSGPTIQWEARPVAGSARIKNMVLRCLRQSHVCSTNIDSPKYQIHSSAMDLTDYSCKSMHLINSQSIHLIYGSYRSSPSLLPFLSIMSYLSFSLFLYMSIIWYHFYVLHVGLHLVLSNVIHK